MKSMLLAISVVTLSTVYLIGCSAKNPSGTNFKDISARDASDLIQKNQGNSNFIILDVRTPAEFDTGHIKDALNVDYESADFSSQISKFDKDKTYLVYCRSGNRSRSASMLLISLGFKNVYNMMDGILQWQAAGFPVVQ